VTRAGQLGGGRSRYGRAANLWIAASVQILETVDQKGVDAK